MEKNICNCGNCAECSARNIEPKQENKHKHEHDHTQEHDHDHEHGGESYKGIIIRLALSAVIFGISYLLPDSYSIIGYIVSYAVIGYDILIRAALGIAKGFVFDEAFLMSIATVGAFAIGEYPEAVMVMFLYQLGELFQEFAVGKARKSVKSLAAMLPDEVNVLRSGELVYVRPGEVTVGEEVVAKPGEKIALDGTIISTGVFSFDTSALTGESVPKELTTGESVLSGYVNLNSTVSIKVTKPESESAAAVIARLTEEQSAKKAKSELFITKFSKVYTPVVVILAVILAFAPMLFTWSIDFSYVNRALSFLVVSCPCALVLSVPLAYFSGIGAASKKGVLIKGGAVIDTLANVSDAVFDKTGTLTTGEFSITKITCGEGYSENEVLRLAAAVESGSNHPIAKAIVKAYKAFDSNIPQIQVREIPGVGVSGILPEGEITVKKSAVGIDILLNGTNIGNIITEDTAKSTSNQTVAELSAMKITSHMLSGDNKNNAEKTASNLGIKDVRADLLPAEKADNFSEIKGKARANVVFVGDGINDAPVLALSDCGFAMGALGQAAAVEVADAVIADDDPEKVTTAIKISQRTHAIAIQNIIFALTVKFLVLSLSALGVTGIEAAVFADVGVSVIAVLNSMRAGNIRKEV
ncbi:MAG: cadmium-translocating P-type ATPase [Ruminococcus sp.]|jgi:Cd2+/Zn2+-exporting ATPase|nr:cadmium-translocating P-type ATPase [Ruminococcus sp.]